MMQQFQLGEKTFRPWALISIACVWPSYASACTTAYDPPAQAQQSGLMVPGIEYDMLPLEPILLRTSPGKPKPDDSDDDLLEELLAGLSGGASWTHRV